MGKVKTRKGMKMIRTTTFLTLLGFAFIGAGIWILFNYESFFSFICGSGSYILIGIIEMLIFAFLIDVGFTILKEILD